MEKRASLILLLASLYIFFLCFFVYIHEYTHWTIFNNFGIKSEINYYVVWGYTKVSANQTQNLTAVEWSSVMGLQSVVELVSYGYIAFSMIIFFVVLVLILVSDIKEVEKINCEYCGGKCIREKYKNIYKCVDCGKEWYFREDFAS